MACQKFTIATSFFMRHTILAASNGECYARSFYALWIFAEESSM